MQLFVREHIKEIHDRKLKNSFLFQKKVSPLIKTVLLLCLSVLLEVQDCPRVFTHVNWTEGFFLIKTSDLQDLNSTAFNAFMPLHCLVVVKPASLHLCQGENIILVWESCVAKTVAKEWILSGSAASELYYAAILWAWHAVFEKSSQWVIRTAGPVEWLYHLHQGGKTCKLEIYNWQLSFKTRSLPCTVKNSSYSQTIHFTRGVNFSNIKINKDFLYNEKGWLDCRRKKWLPKRSRWAWLTLFTGH